MKKAISFIKAKAAMSRSKTISIFSDESGAGYIDQAILILTSVVLGALLLAGLYALFGDVVLPRVEQEITRMFNYAG